MYDRSKYLPISFLMFSLVLFHIHKSLYMILDKSMIIFIVTGNNNRIHTIIIYNIKDDLFILPCNTSLCKNNFTNIGIRMLNQLPVSIKEIPVLYEFKRTLKAFLLDHCFYSIDEFLLFGA
jgi:hypothetical protein